MRIILKFGGGGGRSGKGVRARTAEGAGGGRRKEISGDCVAKQAEAGANDIHAVWGRSGGRRSANASSRICRYGPNVIIIVLMETRGSVFRVGIKTKGEFK